MNRYTKDWKEVKLKILIRDDYTCQNRDCLKKCHNLDVHHKNLNKKDNRDENLETLCKSCHIKKHHAIITGIYKKIFRECLIASGELSLKKKFIIEIELNPPKPEVLNILEILQ